MRSGKGTFISIHALALFSSIPKRDEFKVVQTPSRDSLNSCVVPLRRHRRTAASLRPRLPGTAKPGTQPWQKSFIRVSGRSTKRRRFGSPGETTTLCLRTSPGGSTTPTRPKAPAPRARMGAGGEGVCGGDTGPPTPAPRGCGTDTLPVHFSEKRLETFQQQMCPSPKGKKISCLH